MIAIDRRADGPLVVGGRSYASRLVVGSGKYPSMEVMQAAHGAAGAEVVTVALRRLDLGRDDGKNLLDFVPRDRFVLLPNTAGCFTAEDAIEVARAAREMGETRVKLEVLGDPKTLFPDVSATLRAAEVLVREGFEIWAYTNDDPVAAKRLAEIGVAAVMPLGAPIGSGRGILNPTNIEIILEQVTNVPVIVDAGVGTASDVAIAMELGVDGVLLNTAIAQASDPVRMARAMRRACEAGRDAFLAGRIPKRKYAQASTPPKDFATISA